MFRVSKSTQTLSGTVFCARYSELCFQFWFEIKDVSALMLCTVALCCYNLLCFTSKLLGVISISCSLPSLSINVFSTPDQAQ
jgi:hypothetical protein